MSLSRAVKERMPTPMRRQAARTRDAMQRRLARRFCPCCNTPAARFRDHGDPPRPDARCPTCGALERQRVVSLYLDSLDLAGKRVLHVAPEPILSKRLKDAGVRYVSLDLVSARAQVHADLTVGTPFPDESFDLILCLHVLEHIREDWLALGEFKRLLAPGASAVIMVPMDQSREETWEDATIDTPEGQFAAFGHPGHVRWYGRDTADRFRKSGLQVDELDYRLTLKPREIEQMGLGADRRVFVCRSL